MNIVKYIRTFGTRWISFLRLKIFKSSILSKEKSQFQISSFSHSFIEKKFRHRLDVPYTFSSNTIKLIHPLKFMININLRGEGNEGSIFIHEILKYIFTRLRDKCDPFAPKFLSRSFISLFVRFIIQVSIYDCQDIYIFISQIDTDVIS